jgi:excisionase family DNA binding protein
MHNAKLSDHYENPKAKPQGFITVARAARLAQCSKITIRRLIAKRRITVVRWRDRVLIEEKDFAEWNRVRKYRRKPRPAPLTQPIVSEAGQPEAPASEEVRP